MTANELFKHYMEMTHEERTKFLKIFKHLYEADKIVSLNSKEQEDFLND